MIGDDGEIVMPAAFIDTAERFGLIQEIDQWVAKKAIHLLAEHDVRLEVNVSGKSMGDLAIPELVEREIAATGIDPSRLVFEITETAAIANMEQARAFAERLTRLGCRFALDDFGAGFSSFYYLKYLPLDYLKIDGDFIRSLTSSVTDQLVVKSMVDIARGMGMKTIAEFVEAPETVAMLREKGVDYSQGYYHGEPRPVTEEFVRSRAVWRSRDERPRSSRVGRRARPAGEARHRQAGQRLLRQPGARSPDAADAGVHGAHDHVLHLHLGRPRRVRRLVPRGASRVRARDRREDRHVARVQGQRRDGVDGQHQREPRTSACSSSTSSRPRSACTSTARRRSSRTPRSRRSAGCSTGSRSPRRSSRATTARRRPSAGSWSQIDEAYIHCSKHIPALQYKPEGEDSGRRAGDVFKAKNADRAWLQPTCEIELPVEEPQIGEVKFADEPAPTHAASGRRLPLPVRK